MIDIDIKSSCRICLENGAMYPLFESNENFKSIHCKLAVCISEKIKDVEGYPRNICLKCKNTSDTISNFINKFEETCKILQRKIVTVKCEVVDSKISDDDDHDDYEEPLIYDVHLENIIKDEPNIEKKDPTEILGSLSHLTIKKIKVEKDGESQDSNCIVAKVRKKPQPSKGKPQLTGNSNIAKKGTKKPLNGLKQRTRGPSNQTKLLTKLDSEEDVRLSDLKLKLRQNKEAQCIATTEKPPPPKLCDLCGETFTSSDCLSAHKKKKHTERKFKCAECPKDYITEKDLNGHILRQHKNVRTATCETCGKAFFTKKHLGDHVTRVHLRDRTQKRKYAEYKCRFCDRTYHYKRGVVIHERSVHTGERPAICSVCSGAFYDDVYLAEHMRIHTGVTPFKCPVCGRGYTQRGNMKSHMRNHKISELDAETVAKLKPNYFKFMKP